MLPKSRRYPVQPANGRLPVRVPEFLLHHRGQPQPRFPDIAQLPACGSWPPLGLPLGPSLRRKRTVIPHHWPLTGTSQHVSGASGAEMLVLWKSSCLWRTWGWGGRQQWGFRGEKIQGRRRFEAREQSPRGGSQGACRAGLILSGSLPKGASQDGGWGTRHLYGWLVPPYPAGEGGCRGK